MAVEVQIATLEMKDDLLGLLSHFNRDSTANTIEHWNNSIDYRWPVRHREIGFVLADGAKIAGFLNTAVTDREIDGSIERICNIGSWIVLPEYRAHSLRLYLRVLEMEDTTFTSLSARPELVPILMDRFEFKELETEQSYFFRKIYKPLPSLGTLTGRRNVKATTDVSEIEARLPATEKQVLQDHRQFNCGNLLLSAEDRHCYVVFTKTASFRVPYTVVHYVGDVSLFIENIDLARRHFFLYHGTLRFLADTRIFAGHQCPAMETMPMPKPRLFKSTRLDASQIDNLYSELVILNVY